MLQTDPYLQVFDPLQVTFWCAILMGSFSAPTTMSAPLTWQWHSWGKICYDLLHSHTPIDLSALPPLSSCVNHSQDSLAILQGERYTLVYFAQPARTTIVQVSLSSQMQKQFCALPLSASFWCYKAGKVWRLKQALLMQGPKKRWPPILAGKCLYLQDKWLRVRYYAIQYSKMSYGSIVWSLDPKVEGTASLPLSGALKTRLPLGLHACVFLHKVWELLQMLIGLICRRWHTQYGIEALWQGSQPILPWSI